MAMAFEKIIAESLTILGSIGVVRGNISLNKYDAWKQSVYSSNLAFRQDGEHVYILWTGQGGITWRWHARRSLQRA